MQVHHTTKFMWILYKKLIHFEQGCSSFFFFFLLRTAAIRQVLILPVKQDIKTKCLCKRTEQKCFGQTLGEKKPKRHLNISAQVYVVYSAVQTIVRNERKINENHTRRIMIKVLNNCAKLVLKSFSHSNINRNDNFNGRLSVR